MKISYQGQILQEFDTLTRPLGIETAVWPIDVLDGVLGLSAESILETLSEPLSALKTRREYQTEDLVSLTSETPNLEKILEAFAAPHYHTDDEVRICVAGSGIFTIYKTLDDSFDIFVEPQDLIVVPAYTMHSFRLTEGRRITALRVFKENPRWEAVYEWPNPFEQSV